MNNEEQTNKVKVVLSSDVHKATVIFLHGRGGTGEEFCDELFQTVGSKYLNLSELLPNVKWAFPTAQKRYSTEFQEPINEWFDLHSLNDPEHRQDLQAQGLKESIEIVHKIVAEEAAIVGSNRVFLAGLSQGCAVAIHSLLSFGGQLAGFIGICGWLPFRAKMMNIAGISDARARKNALRDFYRNTINIEVELEEMTDTQALIGHAEDDHIVSPSLGWQLKHILSMLGMHLTFKMYRNCGHWFKEPEGIDDVASFIVQSLSTQM